MVLLIQLHKVWPTCLKDTKKITEASLKRICELIQAGVPVYGQAPQAIAGYHKASEEQSCFEMIADNILPISDWMSIIKNTSLLSDFEVKGRPDIDFIHRKTDEEDIYFFSNPDSTARTFDVSFRIGNKQPELWNPMTGEILKKVEDYL